MAQWLFSQALAPSTLRTYHSARERFVSFCNSAKLQTLPLTQLCLCRLVASLASEGVAHKSIKGIGSTSLANMTLVSLACQPSATCCRGSSELKHARTRTNLALACHYCCMGGSGPSFNCTMLWAVSCTCFFGSLRSGAPVP